jgi:PAS domain-containing protein
MHKLRIASEAIAKELRQFIETANAPIFGIDGHDLVNECNQTSEKITGFKKVDILVSDLLNIYHQRSTRGRNISIRQCVKRKRN